jgi:long-chain acyl-CoA synthetase
VEKEFKHWPEGVLKSLNYPQIPVFELLRSSARQWPERNAVIFGGAEMTFTELDQLSDRLATALADLGVSKGDRVAVHLPNCSQFAIAYYGLLKAGAVFVPVSPLLSEQELAYHLNDCGANTYIGFDLLYGLSQAALASAQVRNRILASLVDCYPPITAPVKRLARQPFPEGVTDLGELLCSYPPEPLQVEFDVGEDLAHIAYTSGTTGNPKGAMLTHANVVANCCLYAYWVVGRDIVWKEDKLGVRNMQGDSDSDHPLRCGREVCLAMVPWSQSFVAQQFLVLGIASGFTQVAMPRFDAAEFLKAIPKYGATILMGTPRLFQAMIEHPLWEKIDISEIRVVTSGAAPIPRRILVVLREKIPGVVLETYGAVEMTAVCSMTPASRDGYRPGSVGLPVADTEVMIVDMEDRDKELPTGETGEIVVRGPQIMKGYWGKPGKTADILAEDGWLLSGDIGHLDEDGFLYIMDRKADMLTCQGHRVCPRELEDVLYENPAVALCAVVGKAGPHGEIPVAFVQPMPGNRVTEAELMEYANSRLAGYKKIGMLLFVEQLPMTTTEKILRRELRERVEDMEIVAGSIRLHG